MTKVQYFFNVTKMEKSCPWNILDTFVKSEIMVQSKGYIFIFYKQTQRVVQNVLTSDALPNVDSTFTTLHMALYLIMNLKASIHSSLKISVKSCLVNWLLLKWFSYYIVKGYIHSLFYSLLLSGRIGSSNFGNHWIVIMSQSTKTLGNDSPLCSYETIMRQFVCLQV